MSGDPELDMAEIYDGWDREHHRAELWKGIGGGWARRQQSLANHILGMRGKFSIPGVRRALIRDDPPLEAALKDMEIAHMISRMILAGAVERVRRAGWSRVALYKRTGVAFRLRLSPGRSRAGRHLNRAE